MDESINNTSFAIKLTEYFRQLSDDTLLKKHQQLVIEYLKSHRGLLVQHDLGTGKSLVASSFISQEIKMQLSRQVIFLSAKTLHGNMEKTLNKYATLTDEERKKFSYVTMNASNMIDQMKKITVESSLDDKLVTLSSLNLNGCAIIVDEAHNLFNAITNGSKNAVAFYNAVMAAKDIKIVFLSGTPIVNHPFELVPCFNMIAGQNILPTVWEDFNTYFIDNTHDKIRNKVKFQNRISGLLSYYGQMYFTDVDNNSRVDYPTLLSEEHIKVQMSSYQYQYYSRARKLEMAESSFGLSSGEALMKPKGVFTSSYRRLSRQFSNIVYPDYAIHTKERNITLMPDKLDIEDIEPAIHCPKFKAIIDKIKSTDGKTLIYSSFVENAGINMLAMVMQHLYGYSEFTLSSKINDNNDSKIDNIDKTKVKKKLNNKVNKLNKQFIRITGDIPFEDRQQLLDIYNDENNAKGDLIRVVMISGAGAEGLHFLGLRHIHIMEPYWNWMRMNQVIGRGIRYKSHIQLDKKDHNVRVYIYVASHSSIVKSMKKDNITSVEQEPTTDEQLINKSLSLYKLIKQFYKALAEASIDCGYHNKNPDTHCRLCVPTGEPLYINDIHKDLSVRSPCKPYKVEEVTAEEVLINGIKYAIETDDNGQKTVYKWDGSLNSYIEVPLGDPIYKAVL